mgnify:CR=1 FL=1
MLLPALLQLVGERDMLAAGCESGIYARIILPFEANMTPCRSQLLAVVQIVDDTPRFSRPTRPFLGNLGHVAQRNISHACGSLRS